MRQPQSATNTLRPAQVIPHHTQRHIAAPLSIIIRDIWEKHKILSNRYAFS